MFFCILYLIFCISYDRVYTTNTKTLDENLVFSDAAVLLMKGLVLIMKKIIKAMLAGVMATAMTVSMAACAPAKIVTINAAEDLANYTVGCQTGTTGETWFKEQFSKDAKGFKTGMDAALALKNGQIDAIVIDELPAKSIVEKNSDLKILDIQFSKEEYAIAIAKGNTELQTSINTTIAAMKENGNYEKLANSFMPADGKISIPEKVTSDSTDKTLKMGTNAAFPPFEYVEGDQIVGFDITMSELIASDFGAKLEVINMEFESLIAALQSGTIDFIAAGMSVTEDRLKSVDFSDPYYESQQVIIVKK